MSKIWFSIFILCFSVNSVLAKSICIPIPCAPRQCPAGMVIDENGCITCECIQVCQTVKCSAGFHCEECEAEPCGPYCVPDCQPVLCDMFCDEGFAIDNHGCPICLCKNMCENFMQCPPGSYCVDVEVQCLVPPCPKEATCVPLDLCLMPNNCSLNCEHGFDVDANGCNICQCFDPCKDVVCNDGDKCQVTNTNCDAPPCPPDVQCVHDCNPQNLWCKIKCDFGQVVDEYGCTLCQCFDPCLNVTCAAGQRCLGVAINCVMAPCPPAIGQCFPLHDCMAIRCLMFCEYGYVKKYGCDTCQCLPPPLSSGAI